jgi:hypothetical protein
VARAWLVRRIAGAPLEAAGGLASPAFAQRAPALCAALLSALADDGALAALPGQADGLLTLAEGEPFGPATGAAALPATVEELRGAALDVLAAATDPALLPALHDRLAHACSQLVQGALSTSSAISVQDARQPGDPRARLVAEAERLAADRAAFAVLAVEIEDAAVVPAGVLAAAEAALRSALPADALQAPDGPGSLLVLARGADGRRLAERLTRAVGGAASHHGAPLRAAAGVAEHPRTATRRRPCWPTPTASSSPPAPTASTCGDPDHGLPHGRRAVPDRHRRRAAAAGRDGGRPARGGDRGRRGAACTRLLCQEPRGHADMYGGFLVPPDDDGADLGVLFWHKDGFSTACGHGTIALGAWAVESGRVAAAPDGVTDVVVDVPLRSCRRARALRGRRDRGGHVPQRARVGAGARGGGRDLARDRARGSRVGRRLLRVPFGPGGRAGGRARRLRGADRGGPRGARHAQRAGRRPRTRRIRACPGSTGRSSSTTSARRPPVPTSAT